MALKDLFLVVAGIGLGYLLMNYVPAIASNAVLYGIILIVIGIVGAMFMMKK
ncbi:hypothetical protein HY065_02975 [Candidatus Berkelbacteria bacterium]|nr:hypothetical protein [Candidatus Berkelbacteria bacterium]